MHARILGAVQDMGLSNARLAHRSDSLLQTTRQHVSRCMSCLLQLQVVAAELAILGAGEMSATGHALMQMDLCRDHSVLHHPILR